MYDNPYGNSFESGEPNNPQANTPIPDGQRILQGLLSELPDEARTLVDKVQRDIARIEEQAKEEIAEIRAQAEKKVSDVDSKAENRRKGLLQHAMEQLEPLQKDLFRRGELAMALATFVQILALKARIHNVLPDPGMMRFTDIGKSFYFRVIGSSQGPVWGTDVYTADSHLASAAVHAGAVELGEEGVVKVTVVDMTGLSIRGSMRNGVMTHDWGPYSVGFRVVAASD
ncbi:MAG TPA: LCCL domain-containing protein [Gemmataceae bacterium]|nr:LCCL domain-containing protein [Gemmataceae bacterium]